jgi:hypothetical protein
MLLNENLWERLKYEAKKYYISEGLKEFERKGPAFFGLD